MARYTQPNVKVFFGIHAVVSAAVGIIVKVFHDRINHNIGHDLENLLILLVVPAFYAAYFLSRTVYLTTLAFSILFSFAVEAWIGNINTSSVTIISIIAFIVLVYCEVLNRSVRIKTKSQEEIDRLEKLTLEARGKINSEFLSSTSHEIRTPLHGILGVTYLLNDTPLNNEQKEYLEIIQSSGQTLLSQINDLMDFAYIESNRLKIEPVSMNLHDTVDEACKIMSHGAKEKEIDIIHYYSPTAPRRVIGDPGRIQQILFTLLDNAVKFSGKSNVNVHVDFSREPQQENTFQISVQDSGPGIDKKEFQSLFKVTEPVLSPDGKRSNGLGLPIAKGLVEMMGGTIQAISAPGEGAKFIFTLPLKLNEKQNVSDVFTRNLLAERVEPVIPDIKPVRTRPPRVLLVDDDKVSTFVAVKMLKGFNCQVDTATGGEDAVRKARHGDYEFILMDIEMPGTNGFDATKSIRLHEEETGKRTPIVALTAHALRGFHDRCIAAGMDDYLTKPVTPQRLKAVVEKWVT